jgi:hypothetical protein
MWVEFKGIVKDNSLADLGIMNAGEETVIRLTFHIDTVEGYRELISDDGILKEDESVLYLHNDSSFVVKHSYDELKKMINDNKTI